MRCLQASYSVSASAMISSSACSETGAPAPCDRVCSSASAHGAPSACCALPFAHSPSAVLGDRERLSSSGDWSCDTNKHPRVQYRRRCERENIIHDLVACRSALTAPLLPPLVQSNQKTERQTECFQPLWSQSEVRDQHRLRIAANGKSVEGIGKVTCNGNSGSGCRSSFWGYAHNNRRGQSATSGILHTVTKPCKHRQTGCFKGACPVSEQPNQRDRDNLSTCRVSCCFFKLQFEVQKPAFHSQQPLASHPMLQKQSSSKLGLEAVHVHPDGLLADFAGTFFCEPKAGQG